MSGHDRQVHHKSAQYEKWLACERRDRRLVLTFRIGVLIAFLLAWEFLARSHIVNPMLTSYPSALLPTFFSRLEGSPQQASILAHAWFTVSATAVGLMLAMVLGSWREHSGRRTNRFSQRSYCPAACPR
jgi:NitT/TauT family transport system permease protein